MYSLLLYMVNCGYTQILVNVCGFQHGEKQDVIVGIGQTMNYQIITTSKLVLHEHLSLMMIAD